jgi:hypothetical protein
MTRELVLELVLAETPTRPFDSEDQQAEVIASLTEQDVQRLWSVLIQIMKPHLLD